ncbi:MAG: DUF1868 domain-containing protein [Tabrizicola sp.]
MTLAEDRTAMLAWLTGAATGGAAPASVGQKFTPAGAVMPYAGNTFICHIPQGPAHDALAETAARLRAAAPAGAYAFLPPASYHMTVFEGVTDRDRTGGRWPEDLDPALPVEAVTDHFLPRLDGVNLPKASRIRPTGLFAGTTVQVTGATTADEAALRAARETLRAATGIRRPDFADYRFHITLAYLLRWLTPAEAAGMADLCARLATGLADLQPEIALAGVEFCSFADMHAFPLVARLS